MFSKNPAIYIITRFNELKIVIFTENTYNTFQQYNLQKLTKIQTIFQFLRSPLIASVAEKFDHDTSSSRVQLITLFTVYRRSPLSFAFFLLREVHDTAVIVYL